MASAGELPGRGCLTGEAKTDLELDTCHLAGLASGERLADGLDIEGSALASVQTRQPSRVRFALQPGRWKA